MRIGEALLKIDRRVIYLILGIAVIAPLIKPIGIPVNVMPETQKLFNAIDQIPPNDKPLLISVDFDPAAMPELYPMLLAILRHAFAKNIRVIVLAIWAPGTGLGEMALQTVAPEYNKTYGKDYVFLGYKPGMTAVMLGMGESIRGVFPTDYYGTPLDSLEMMQSIRNYRDIAMCVSLSAGTPGYLEWISYAGARYGLKIGTGVTAVSAADAYPYVQTGQLCGLLAGLKGASEYETLIERHGYSKAFKPACQGMDSQSLAHLVIMIFIVLGNIGYFLTRRQR